MSLPRRIKLIVKTEARHQAIASSGAVYIACHKGYIHRNVSGKGQTHFWRLISHGKEDIARRVRREP